MLRKRIVGVVGGGKVDDDTFPLAREVGRLLAEGGALVLCGGGGGVMEAVAQGARDGGGKTIGVLPFAKGAKDKNGNEKRPNRFVDCALFTGLGDGRNYVNARTSDALIALRGGPGTLSEIALAAKIGVPVVLLGAWKCLAGCAELDGAAAVHVETAAEAVARAFALIGPAPDGRLDRPLTYPALPDQSALREQLRQFLEKEVHAPPPR